MNCLRQENGILRKMNVALSAVEYQLKKTFAVEKLVHENFAFFAYTKISQKTHTAELLCVDFHSLEFKLL